MTTIENAVTAHENGDLETAEGLYLGVLQEDPGQADAMHLLGLLYRAQRKYPQAQQYLQQAIDTAPEIGAFYNSLGGCHQDQGDYVSAKELYIQSIQRQVNSAEVYNNLAFIQIAEKNLEEAEKNLRLAIQLNPDYGPAYINLGNTLLETGEFSQAANCMQQALNLQPESPVALAGLGRAYLAQGVYGVAAQCFRSATDKRPDFGRAYALLGECELADGRLEEARAAYEQAIAVQPDLADGYEGMGDLLAAQGQADEAIEYYGTAAEKPSRKRSILRKAGQCYAQSDRHRAAIDCYKGCLNDNDSDHAEIYRLLAKSLTEIGENAAALECMKKASEAGGDNATRPASEALILEQSGLLDQAEAAADASLAKDDNQFELQMVKARAEIRHGLLDEAGQRLAQLLPQFEKPGQQSEVQAMRAVVFDRDEAYAEAGNAMAEAHRLRALSFPPMGDLATSVGRMIQLGEWSNAERFGTWPQEAPDNKNPAPCFLVGLPGSGVEVLAQTLAAHSQIQVLEDRFQGQETRLDFVNQVQTLPELDDLAENQQMSIRRRYWKAVERMLAEDFDGLVIDRIPSDQASLECIYRIFPEARVILVGRDDNDLALEYMMSSPIPELQANGVATLEDFRHYATAFSALMNQYRITLPLSSWALNLEDLLDEPRTHMDDLMEYLALSSEEQQIQVLGAGVDSSQQVNWLLVPGHWRNYAQLLGVNPNP